MARPTEVAAAASMLALLSCADAQADRPSWPTTGRKATASAAVRALGLVRARVRLRVRARARARVRARV